MRAAHLTDSNGHSLRRKLLIGTGIALVCTAVLAAGVIMRSVEDYHRANQNLRGLESYRLILLAANLLSAERGPANSLLGDSGADREMLRERLAMFRARADASLDRLAAPSGPSVPADLLKAVKAQLLEGRQNVDRVAAMPRERRSVDDVEAAIESMVKVVDTFAPIVSWKARLLTAASPGLAGAVMTGKIFSDLREYGGRIGSQIMAPIAVGEPMRLKNFSDSNRTRGRIVQLWSLIETRSRVSEDPRVVQGLNDADTMFFGKGLAIVDGMIAEGRKSGAYTMTADEFTVRYVETLKPLELLRGAYLDSAVDRLTQISNHALVLLGATAGMTALILAILVSLKIAAQRIVFSPLMRARDAVISLAEDRPMVLRQDQPRASEMRRLFDAIDVLRGSLAERSSLVKQLKLQAETDSLTGLMNRRALDMIGESHAGSDGMADDACLVLMDIDHFKAINDRHGHLEGDLVLQETVRLIRPLLEENDLFARFGGEEFVILRPNRDVRTAADLAEQIRQVLEASEIALSNGVTLHVTASFGVASGNLGQLAWRRLIGAADAALYRAKSDGRNRVRQAQPAFPSLVPNLPDDAELAARPQRSTISR